MPVLESGGAATRVHDYVKDFALQDGYQFSLGIRVLEVEAAQDSALGEGEVVLDEGAGYAGFLVTQGVERFHEKAALVTEDFGFDDNEAGERAGGEVHVRLKAKGKKR